MFVFPKLSGANCFTSLCQPDVTFLATSLLSPLTKVTLRGFGLTLAVTPGHEDIHYDPASGVHQKTGGNLPKMRRGGCF